MNAKEKRAIDRAIRFVKSELSNLTATSRHYKQTRPKSKCLTDIGISSSIIDVNRLKTIYTHHVIDKLRLLKDNSYDVKCKLTANSFTGKVNELKNIDLEYYIRYLNHRIAIILLDIE